MDHRDVMKKLIDNGHGAWIVGGAVRDKLMGSEPKDYDLATTAVPEVVLEMFPGSKYINAAFSVAVYVPIGDHSYVEVVTTRKERAYKSGRPTDFEFVSDIETDLARRDATINAMAMDYDGKIIDPFNGQDDIKNNTIRAVGDPKARIAEHPIRMMRYIRFAATLGFVVEEGLDRDITTYADQIRRENWEAISAEFIKALDNKNAQIYLYMLQRHGILGIILPEVDALKGLLQNKHHDHDVWMHTLFAVSAARHFSAIEKLAVLLHDVGKPATVEYKGKGYGNSFHGHEVDGKEIASVICDRLRLSKYDTGLICDAVRWHMYPIKSAKTARKFVSSVSRNIQDREEIKRRVEFVLGVRRADKFAHKRTLDGTGADVERSLVMNVLEQEQPFSIKDLRVNGYEVMSALDIKQGRIVGEVLSHLLDLVVSDSIGNVKEDLLSEAKEYYGRQHELV